MSDPTLLTHFLRTCGKDEIKMSFDEIASVLEEVLPASASKYNAWWSNNPTNNPRTYGWLNADYRTRELNLTAKTVVFFKT